MKRKATTKRKKKGKSQRDNLYHAITMVHHQPDGVHIDQDGRVQDGVHHIGIERRPLRRSLLNQPKRDDLSVGNDRTEQKNCIYLLIF